MVGAAAVPEKSFAIARNQRDAIQRPGELDDVA
jgi:hypothetical protein